MRLQIANNKTRPLENGKKKTCRGPAVCRHVFTKVFLDARGHVASHHPTINSSATERCACLVECFHSYGVHSQEQHCGSRLLYYKNSFTEISLAWQALVQEVFGFPGQTIKLNPPGSHKVATPQPWCIYTNENIIKNIIFHLHRSP